MLILILILTLFFPAYFAHSLATLLTYHLAIIHSPLLSEVNVRSSELVCFAKLICYYAVVVVVVVVVVSVFGN